MAAPTFKEEELADVFAYIFISRYEGLKADRARGEAAYRQKGCVTCHGPSGEGGMGPVLRGVTTGESKERVVQRMWNHAPQMWDRMGTQKIPWPRFDADDLGGLLAFLSEDLKAPAAAGAKAKAVR
jgi:mono/diheme cytochrome c family protein